MTDQLFGTQTTNTELSEDGVGPLNSAFQVRAPTGRDAFTL